MSLCVVTGMAFLGSCVILVQVAAVTAAPDNFSAALKDASCLSMSHQIVTSLFMLFFRHPNGFKGNGNLPEPAR